MRRNMKFWKNRDYKKRIKELERQFKELDDEFNVENMKLSLHIKTDGYKDDLIATLQKLLSHKNDMIIQLSDDIQKLKNP